HPWPDAGMKTLVLQDRNAVRRGLTGIRCRRGKSRRAVPPNHLRTRLHGESVSKAQSSGQAFEETLSQNDELRSRAKRNFAAEYVILAAFDLVQESAIDG